MNINITIKSLVRKCFLKVHVIILNIGAKTVLMASQAPDGSRHLYIEKLYLNKIYKEGFYGGIFKIKFKA